ncbi:MAG TPA: hypothetical protein VE987_15680 [Polyangiaceae bacterium]|nr:hypothetical protein [Polyangiaceae bacterium]
MTATFEERVKAKLVEIYELSEALYPREGRVPRVELASSFGYSRSSERDPWRPYLDWTVRVFHAPDNLDHDEAHGVDVLETLDDVVDKMRARAEERAACAQHKADALRRVLAAHGGGT